MADLPLPRRIVASNAPIKGGNTHAEPAVQVETGTLEPISIFDDNLRRTPLATHKVVPTTTNGVQFHVDTVPDSGIVLPGGVNVYYLDLAPGFQTPMHRTVSTDHLTVVYGTPSIITPRGPFDVLDGKGTYTEVDEQQCKPGDHIIQRGIQHALANKSDSWARFLCVVLDAKAESVPVGGESEETRDLGESWLSN